MICEVGKCGRSSSTTRRVKLPGWRAPESRRMCLPCLAMLERHPGKPLVENGPPMPPRPPPPPLGPPKRATAPKRTPKPKPPPVVEDTTPPPGPNAVKVSPKTCAASDCGRPVKARWLCPAHYCQIRENRAWPADWPRSRDPKPHGAILVALDHMLHATGPTPFRAEELPPPPVVIDRSTIDLAVLKGLRTRLAEAEAENAAHRRAVLDLRADLAAAQSALDARSPGSAAVAHAIGEARSRLSVVRLSLAALRAETGEAVAAVIIDAQIGGVDDLLQATVEGLR